MKCPKCHNANIDAARYCVHCGTRLSSDSGDQTITQTYPRSRHEPIAGNIFARRYFIIEELGAGGMGKVYRALDQQVNETVALKIIKPEIASQPKVLDRFRNELVIARRIIHKNVCRMFELMEEDGTYFITMEFVTGENLRSFIKRSREMTEASILELALQICKGLSEAHNLGIVHRDLKPSNIMIDKEGNAKVMDFGIARSGQDSKLTASGVISGTPDYMSPEQVEGIDLDQRSDIYSLGVVLFEMATGRLPFEGETPLRIALKRRVESPKPPKACRPRLSEGLNRIILKCLEPGKEARYQDVGQIIHDLDRLTKGEVIIPSSLKRKIAVPKIFEKKRKLAKQERRWIRAAALLSLIFLAMFLGIHLIGQVNDYIYRAKLGKIAVEYDTYYKHLFPIKKTWLPADWPASDCNAFNTYKRILFAKFDDAGKYRPKAELDSDPAENVFKDLDTQALDAIFDKLKYKDVQELGRYRDQNMKSFAFLSDLYSGAKCSKNNAGVFLLAPDVVYNALYLIRYTKLALLDARIDFLYDRPEDGLKKLHLLSLVLIDLQSISTSLIGDLAILYSLRQIYKELVTVTLAQWQDFRLESFSPILELSRLWLEQIDIQKSCYKEYLYNGKVFYSANKFDLVFQQIGNNRILFSLFGRFFVRKFSFSFYKALYSDVEPYGRLFEEMKYVRGDREKSIFLRDYSSKIEKEKDEHLGVYFASYSTVAFRFNIARTLIKTFLLVHYSRQYGLNSTEFLRLLGDDIYINEFSGSAFNIVIENGVSSIVLDEKVHLSLKNIDYKSEHKKILEGFMRYDLLSHDLDDLKSIFYSFELE